MILKWWFHLFQRHFEVISDKENLPLDSNKGSILLQLKLKFLLILAIFGSATAEIVGAPNKADTADTADEQWIQIPFDVSSGGRALLTVFTHRKDWQRKIGWIQAVNIAGIKSFTYLWEYFVFKQDVQYLQVWLNLFLALFPLFVFQCLLFFFFL